MSDNTSNSNLTFCDVEVTSGLKLILLSCGAALAVLGSACNLLLFIVFVYRPRRCSTLYYKVLALLDLLLCLTYIWMFVLPKLAVAYRIAFLYHMVWDTNIYVYTLGRTTQCAIPYIIIASTAERLTFITHKSSVNDRGIGRALIVTLLLIVIVGVRVPSLWAMQLTTVVGCDLFESKYLSTTSLINNETYKTFDIVVNFLHIIASFLILTFLNGIIIAKLQRIHLAVRKQRTLLNPRSLLQERALVFDEGRTERRRLRVAIKTSIVIISAYLACNSLHFCLFLVEQFNPALLIDETGFNFTWTYAILCDIVTILFVVSSTIRLPIYYNYNPDIRAQIRSLFSNDKKERN
ncbi:hypothetical protein AB6A40_000146 [Gnathostoma spinigerum]|uniref:G-protein coupled receptors family 1 profile domain-containing protein n=1 Tax=Gnathostoma spinigerum TaxID=75299 RepID=A0ABD6E3K9_9BILA